VVLQTLSEDDYYDLHNLLSRNAQWNFIIGARGLGKTFATKRYGIKEYLKHGHEFIYLRRTDVEQKRKETFFKDIQSFFPEYAFRVNGEKGQLHKNSWDEKDWRTCCYFVALSQAGGLKSVAYPKVHLIIFDEIFPDNLRFLSNEVNSFSEFYNTVDRWQDRTKVLFLSNAVQKANPYFAKYKLDIGTQQANQQQYKLYCNGFICLELADYGGFSAKVAKSKFGRFLEQYDSNYADYAIRNQFRDESDTLIAPIPSDSDLSYVLDTTNYGLFGIWITISEKDGHVSQYISRRIPKENTRPTYTLDPNHVDEKTWYVKKSDDVIRRLTTGYRLGKIRFENPQVKADFALIIGDLLGK
jgi:hypothetical protein